MPINNEEALAWFYAADRHAYSSCEAEQLHFGTQRRHVSKIPRPRVTYPYKSL